MRLTDISSRSLHPLACRYCGKVLCANDVCGLDRMLRDDLPMKQTKGGVSKKAAPEILAILSKYQGAQQKGSSDEPAHFALAREVIRRAAERRAAEQAQSDDEKKDWYLP